MTINQQFVLKQPKSDDLQEEDYREYDFDTCMENSNWKGLPVRLYSILYTSSAGHPSYQKAAETTSIKDYLVRMKSRWRNMFFS